MEYKVDYAIEREGKVIEGGSTSVIVPENSSSELIKTIAGVGLRKQFPKGDIKITSIHPIKGPTRVKNFDVLANLREQLFDAPSEIKSAFNGIIKYFDSINLKGRTIEVFSVTGSHNDNVSKHIVIDINKEENIRKEIRYIIKCQDKFIVDLSESEYKELISEGFTLGNGYNGGYTIVTLSGLDLSRGKKYRN